MAHVEINQKTKKISIHIGNGKMYGPIDNSATALALSRWIVKLLKRVARLEEHVP
jgi:hypothetical protein